jgi:methylmalonyl-CoA/ethylmalonyl-CoA epimerase
MNSIKINHIGIACNPESLRTLNELFQILDLSPTHTEAVPDQKVLTHFYTPVPSATHLELLEPVGEDGPISMALGKRGPGVHHIAFELASGTLDSSCQKLRIRGFRLIYDTPKQGAHGMRINFVHPASAGGILIELMESGS